jgi:phosphate transport system substrate-binding protein
VVFHQTYSHLFIITMKAFKALPIFVLTLPLLFTSCGKKEAGTGGSSSSQAITASGSSTLQPIVSAWAEAYEGTVKVAGGGTGVGIEDLIAGRSQICNASRAMKPEEKEKLKASTGKEAKEFVVGIDALAIFVHKDNPVNEISVAEVAEIFKKDATVTKWEQLAGGAGGEIIPFGREKTSGTYEYFQEATVGKKGEFAANVSPQSSSSAIIGQITSIKSAIGYDGMAFKTDGVKWLKLSKAKGEPAVEPNADDARNKKYPLARPLFLYTAGEPEGETKKFIDFALSDEGQKILAKAGAVSLR